MTKTMVLVPREELEKIAGARVFTISQGVAIDPDPDRLCYARETRNRAISILEAAKPAADRLEALERVVEAASEVYDQVEEDAPYLLDRATARAFIEARTDLENTDAE